MGRPAHPWFRSEKNTWYATVGGKTITLGVRGRDKEREAWKAYERLTRSGRFFADPTVAELVKDFLDARQRTARPHTGKVYGQLLKRLTDRYATTKASALKPLMVEHLSEKETWGADTRADFIGAVVTVVRWGVREGLLKENPLDGVRKPRKVSRGRKAVLSQEQIQKLFTKANKAHLVLLKLLHLTGARPSEIFRATAAQIDLENQVIVLEQHKTSAKTGVARMIYLVPEAVEILRPLVARYPEGPVLRRLNGTPWDQNSVYGAMRRLKRRTGVQNATTYGFRHTWCTDALAGGVPDAHVAELVGHKGTAMLSRHYAHLSQRSRELRVSLGRVRSSPPAPDAVPDLVVHDKHARG